MRMLIALFLPLMLATTVLAADPAPQQHGEDVAHAAAEHASDHGGDHAEPSVFAGTIAQSVAAAIVFLVLLAVLYRAAWGPILKGLQDRENKIREDLERAERSVADANRTLETYKAQVAKAQEEAARIVENGKRTAERLAQQIEEQARAEINDLRKRSMSELTFAKETAIAEIYTQAASVSADLAGQILKREIKPDDHRDLVNRVLEKVKA